MARTVTPALLDTGSQVTHVVWIIVRLWVVKYTSIDQLVNIEGALGTIEYVGFIEADNLFLWEPMCSRLRPSLVLPTTEYQKRVPVTIGTSLTDMAVDY